MADCIQFNFDHFAEELQFFGQEWMELSEDDTYSQEEYEQALITGPALAGTGGIDATLANYGDAIVAPTNTPAWPNDLINGDAFLSGSSSFAAVAGYPLVTVPMGSVFELPVGIIFMASAWSERRSSGWPQASRRPRRHGVRRAACVPSTRRTRAAGAGSRAPGRVAIGRGCGVCSAHCAGHCSCSRSASTERRKKSGGACGRRRRQPDPPGAARGAVFPGRKSTKLRSSGFDGASMS
jgi:hypothetical protein